MARAPRIVYPGAVYHITSRGNRRANIYVDDRDFLTWQDRLAATVSRYNFAVHAFCQMPNHYHLLVEAVEGNLSDGMHYLNSTYAQKFNQRHALTGHVVQGRFHAVPIKSDAQLLVVARYIAQNPVRAKLVQDVEAWRWGSHNHLCGLAPALPWLAGEWLLGMFGATDATQALPRYRAFVRQHLAVDNPLADHSERGPNHDARRRREAQSLAHYQAHYADRNEAMAQAFLTTAYRIDEIAAHFGVSAKTVSRAVAKFRK
jgi:REP element-mobilizing transposase RayT